MNPEWKEKWITALRSGEYQQCKYQLKEDNSFCCLGVLTDLVIKESDGKYFWSDDSKATVGYSMFKHDDGVLPYEVKEITGLGNSDDPFIDGRSLSSWNDDMDYTFEHISHIIEGGL